ncbi:MAG: dockerin type I domain-containing protein, partial [Planctomycetota bacterium]
MTRSAARTPRGPSYPAPTLEALVPVAADVAHSRSAAVSGVRSIVLLVAFLSFLAWPAARATAQMQAGRVTSDGTLELIDVDGDGVNTFGDRDVVLWWIFSGGDVSLLWEALAEARPGAGGLYDLSGWLSSPEAQLPSGASGAAGAAAVAAAAGGGGGACPCPVGSPECETDPALLDCEFIRGDANRDFAVNVADVTFILEHLFQGGPVCDQDATDVNDDGSINISDAVRLLDFLFSGGAPIVAPWPAPGLDPTVDSLNLACSDFDLGSVVSAVCDESRARWEGLCFLDEPPEQMGDSSGTGGPGGNPFAFSGKHVCMPPDYWWFHKPIITKPAGGGGGAAAGGSAPPRLPPFPGAGGECLNFTCPEASGGSSLDPFAMFSIGPGTDNNAGFESVLGHGSGDASVSDGWQDLCNLVGFPKYGILDENGVEWASGGYHFSRSYLELPGRGMDYSFSVTYRSLPYFAAASGALGMGWDHYYFQRLQPWFTCDGPSAGFLRVVEGQVEYYRNSPSATDLYLQVNEGYNRLAVIRNSGNAESLVVRTPGGMLFSYCPFSAGGSELERQRGGRLQFIRDRHGNQITCFYEAVPGIPNRERLASVVDTLGRVIEYDYWDDDPNDLDDFNYSTFGIGALLKSVTYGTRQVLIRYDVPEEGKGWPGEFWEPYVGPAVLLSEIRGPAVTLVPPGGTPHPGERLHFDYRSHFRLGEATVVQQSVSIDPITQSVDPANHLVPNAGSQFIIPLLTHIYAEDGVDLDKPFLRIKYDDKKARVTETLYGDVTAYQLALEAQVQMHCDAGGGMEFADTILQLMEEVRGGTTTYQASEFPGKHPCSASEVAIGQAETFLRVTRINAGGGIRTANFDASGSLQSVIQPKGWVFGGHGRLEAWEGRLQQAEDVSTVLYGPSGEPLPCSEPCTWATYYKRNAKGQPILTVYPNGNCVATEYDETTGGVTTEHAFGVTRLIVSSPRPSAWGGHFVRFLTFEPDAASGYLTLTKRRFEPIFAQVIEEWDPRNPDVVAPGTWQSGQPGYYAYGNQSATNLRTRSYLDYQVAGALPASVQALVDAFGLPTPGIGDYAFADSLPTGLQSGSDGNVVGVRFPETTRPDNSTSGEAIQVYRFGPGGRLLVEVNPEGVATTYDYYSSADPGNTGESLSVVASPYPALLGQSDMNWPGAQGGFLSSTTEDDPAWALPRGTDRVTPEPASTVGRQTTYGYDIFGNTTVVTDPLGRVRTKYFDERNRAYREVDPLGFEKLLYYSAASKLIREEVQHGWVDWDGTALPGGPEILADDGVTRLVPERWVTAYKYDFAGNLVARSETYRLGGVLAEAEARTWLYFYSIDQQLIEEVDPRGYITNYAYDERGLLRFKLVGNNASTVPTPPVYLGGPGFPENGTLSGYGQPSLMATGVPASFNVDPLASFKVYGYDGGGNLVCESDAVDHGNSGGLFGDLITYHYDEFDRLVQVSRPNGAIETTIYDPAGNVVVSRVSGLGLDSSEVQPFAQPLDVEGAMSFRTLAETHYEFDERNRQVLVHAQLLDATGGVVDTATTASHFDRMGAVTRVDDPAGKMLLTRYDRLGRKVRSASGAVARTADFAQTWSDVETYYDLGDRVIEERITERELGVGGALVSSAVYWSTHAYDLLDRVLRTVDTLGQAARFRYDARGHVVESTDARGPASLEVVTHRDLSVSPPLNDHGNVTARTYDRFGREVEVARAMTLSGEGGSPLADLTHPQLPGEVIHDEWLITRAAYDLVGHVLAQTDATGRVTQYEYDGLGRLILTTHSSGATESYEYDNDNLRTAQVDENGTRIEFEYDDSHHEVRRDIVSAGRAVGSGAYQRRAYDDLDRVVWAFDSNVLGSSVDDHTCTMVYDTLGRMTHEYFDDDLQDKVVSEYDGVGNKTRLVYPWSGEDLSIGFDDQHRVSWISRDAGATNAVTYTYAGSTRRVLTRAMTAAGTGILTTATYDAVGRGSTLEHLVGGALGQRFENVFNRAGHRVSESRTYGMQPEREDMWNYDSANRLVGECEGIVAGDCQTGEQRAYWLDGAGNWRVLAKTLGGTTTTDLNEIGARNEYTSFEGESYSHDAAGNRTAAPGDRTYVYDGQKRLVAIERELPGGGTETVAQYEYFADHRRARKELGASGVGLRYLYDGARLLEIGVELGLGVAPQQAFIYGGGRGVVLRQDFASGQDHAFLADPLGSTTGLVGAAGLVETYEYDAYGQVTYGDAQGVAYAPGAQASLHGNDILYAGYLYESEVAHYWLQFRVYDPHTGRFL